MANSNVGAKFLSVNLNKSYGQSGNSNSSATSGSGYGSGRGRVGSHGGGLSGGGMVVLSRPRSSHKPGPKLSVPPPLNLPSLRKEKKRFDSPQSGTSSIGGVASGSGPRPASSGSGWSKPSSSAVGMVGRDGVSGGCSLSSESSQQGQLNLDGSNRLGTANLYMPPSARPGSAGPDTSVPIIPEKTSVLRGEDFPSLKATLVSSNGSLVKQKDGTHQKQQKEGTGEEISTGQRDRSKLSLDIDMHPHLHPSQLSLDHDLAGNGNDENHGVLSSQLSQSVRKPNDYFPAPLPLVSLSPRSDWADDERDISHGLTERTRVDHTHSKTEPYWETDFDFPRGSIFPHKPAKHHFDRRAYPDGDNSGKALVSEASNVDPYSRDGRTHSREGRDGNLWRASLSKDGFNVQDSVDRSSIGARQNKYMGPQVCGPVKNDYEFRNTESVLERKDAGYGQGAGQNRNYSADLSNERGVDSRTNYRYKANSGQSSLASKSSGYQGHSGFDPLLKFGRDQRVFSRGEKPYTEGWESSSFDGEDPFSNGLFGVMRRKKDVAKQADFHDPVRESFEAELERVQKLQELERQRIIEEQERSIEMARREEEERQRIAREQEERQRRLEEEAVEAAMREEHERLEAIRIAEEQKTAKEEERRRILMEEERRKEAARQKLQELEERIARRQAEATKADDAATSADERMVENEKMVERITNSASSDSSTLNRPQSMDTRGAHSLREGPFAFIDRGKSNSIKRNVFESTNKSYYPLEQADGHHSLRRDTLGGERTFPSKDFYGGNGHMSSSKVYYRGKNSEPHRDHLHVKPPRWNLSSDVGDAYGRNPMADSEFHEGFVDGFNDFGWGQGHSRGNFRSFADQMQQNPELDELYGYARPRFSIRQPRVLPPPSLASVHRSPFRNVSDHPGSSTYDDGRSMNNNHESRSEFSALNHGDGQEDMKNQPYTLDVQEEIGKSEDQDLTGISALRCDSQSSLSVSSPPHSPAHLSHDDLDESGDYLVETAPSKTNMISLPGNDSVVLSTETGKEILCTDSGAVPVDDDDEWPIVRNEELQEQEEYDEDEEGYHEEEEVHVRDDNVDLLHEFEGLHLGGKGSTSMMDNLVLGFDQGVEVGIPGDEYERSPTTEENSSVAPLDSTGIVVAPVSDVRQDEGSTIHFNDGSHMISSCTPGIIHGTQSMGQDSVMQPIDAPHSSASSDLLCYADATSILPGPQSVPSSVNMGSFTSSPAIVSSSASTQGEAEAPVKLQFGLFSGPSLIPSPIPSIQIGSIQMPLQLHPQVGPSVTHMHPPQPHFFQFGQLRYPSPISQGLLPLALQPMSFNQPNVQATYSLNQKPSAPISVHLSRSSGEDNALVTPMEKPHIESVKGSSSQIIEGPEHTNVALHQNQTEESNDFWNKGRVESGQKAENGGSKYDAARNANSESVTGSSKGLLQARTPAVHSYSSGKGIIGSPLQGQMSGHRGRRMSFTAGRSGQKMPFASVDASHGDSHGFQKKPRRAVQRMEFRVRQTADAKRSFSSLNKSGINAKSSNNQEAAESIPRNSLKKEMLLGGSKQTIDAGNFSSALVNFQNTTSVSKTVRINGKDASNASHPGDGSLKRNIWTENDVDPPLQSGVVRVFNQPGIEAPSDEDNFIEVRSKRQMLNDRREQRDKEIKAKTTSNKKVMQKHRSGSHSTPLVRATLNKVATPSNGNLVSAIDVDATAQKREFRSDEESARFSMVSPPLDPIGTPCVNTKSMIDARSQSIKALQASSLPSKSSCGSTVGVDFTCDSNKNSLDSAPISLVSLSNSHINQEVMPLTQTQFDEAMHPAQYNTTSRGDCSKPISEPCMSTSSVLLKNTPFQSSTSPVNSLLAGEKIQFGAVTSPTALPHTSNHAASHGMGSTSSSSHSDPRKAENDSSFCFENKKQPEDASSYYFEDCEAEAAASALAVAAISSNDDAAQNGLGTNSVSMSDAENYSGIRGDGIPAGGVAGNHPTTNEPKAEEPLTVSLPADLSVETPPISLWPPLQSPQSSASQILSPFPGSTPLHLPFYDMNSMMGGPPVFAFGPHNEATGSQSQPQKSSSSGPGSLGAWQHCRSGMDSFYGPPAGYAGPFINQPGGVQGVQGQPHMLVYNHFAPVGQFGQVGLSYMGTYIPSGKQPDWEHTPSGGGGGGGEGEMKNTNVISAQDNPSKTHVQHLAMGSPLMPMPSHMAMFDVSPFQPSTSVSVQPHWSHVPPPLQSIPPQSMPLLPQQPGGAVITPQLNYGPADSNSVATNRLDTKPLMPLPCSDGGHTLAAESTESASNTHFGNTHGLAGDPRNSAVLKSSGHDGSNEALVTKDAVISSQQAGGVNKSNMHLKNPTRQQHQYNRQSRYGNQNGGAGGSSQNGSGAEWSNNRKMGFNGRNHPSGGHRSGFPPTKMKQIYVAKQSSCGGASNTASS